MRVGLYQPVTLPSVCFVICGQPGFVGQLNTTKTGPLRIVGELPDALGEIMEHRVFTLAFARPVGTKDHEGNSSWLHRRNAGVAYATWVRVADIIEQVQA